MVAVLGAMMLAAMVPVSAGSWRLVPVAAALFVIGAVTVDSAAVACVAALAYLFVAGFLVNQYGVLTWHGMPDIYRLVVIAISASAGLMVGALRRWSRRPRPLMVPPEWVAVLPAPRRHSR
jgi:predicted membrane protein